MSTQINQFLIYGLKVPAKWPEQWNKKHLKEGKEWYDTFEGFMDDSAFTAKVKHKDGVFMLYDGMNGDYIIIGKVHKKTSDGEFIDGPLCISDLPTEDKDAISESIKRNFDLEGELKWYFVTHYR